MPDNVESAIRDVLVDAARRRQTTTYGALLDALSRDERAYAEADLAPILRAISVAEDDAGRGLLTAVVVRDDTGLPGVGWFRLAADRGRDVSDPRAGWEREIVAVFAAWAGAE